MRRRTRESRPAGFTLVELLVVIGIIALLIAILLPMLKQAQHAAQRTACMSNQRQLVLAWQMYCDDSKGQLPGAWPDQSANFSDALPWVLPGNSPASIQGGCIYKYTKNIKVYHCPGDFWVHLSSYGMNSWLNGEGTRIEKRQKIKYPTKVFVFIDENDWRSNHNAQYNLGSFMVNSATGSRRDVWIDYPGTWHANGACLSFADGHAEYRKWLDTRTLGLTTNNVSTPNNQDLQWLQTVIGH